MGFRVQVVGFRDKRSESSVRCLGLRTGEVACASVLSFSRSFLTGSNTGFPNLGWVLGFGFWGLGFEVWGMMLGVQCWRFEVWGVGFRVWGARFGFLGIWVFEVWGLGCGVSCFAFRVPSWGVVSRVLYFVCRLPGFVFRASASSLILRFSGRGFRVQGCRVSGLS